MNSNRMIIKSGRVILSMLALMAAECRAATPPVLSAGVGQSVLESPAQAGEEAARMAQAALDQHRGASGAGGEAPVTVLIMATASVFKPELVEGVARVFPDKARIFGAACWRPIGNEDVFSDQALDRDKGHGEIKAGVSVLALAGAITVSVASAEAAPQLVDCGQRIGKALSPALQESAPGKLVLTFGPQPYRKNPPYLDGLLEGLGCKVPVLGLSTRDDQVIVQGRISRGINVALLLQGAFAVSCDIQPGVELAATVKAAESVFKPSPEPYVAALVANCAGRAGALIKRGQLSRDWATLHEKAPQTALFGGYGAGEIGTRPDGSVLASGHCIGLVALKPK